MSALTDVDDTPDDESIHPNGATAGSRYGRIDRSSGSVVTRLFDSDAGGDLIMTPLYGVRYLFQAVRPS